MKKAIKLVIPILVLAAGAAAAVFLVKSGPRPSREATPSSAPLVEVTEPAPHTGPVEVEAMGEVIPAREVTIQPEVSGKLIWVSEKLVPGGTVNKGELLARIDPADYRLAVTRAEAALAQAERDLAVEKARGQVAAQEWKLSRVENATREGEDLALRKPQLRGAEAGRKSAQSLLAQARLNLERTRIRAPFDAFVRSEAAEPGTQVSPQSRLATLVGSREAWIQASIPVGDLRWVELPGKESRQGSKVTVEQDLGDGQAVRREGRVIRLLRELDPLGKMAQVVVSVPEPFATRSEDDLPLLVGAMVRITLHGRSVDDLFVLPREVVRDGDRVFVVDDAGKLSVREIDLVQGREGEVLTQSGVGPGDRVVVSPLAGAVEGMTLRVLTPPPPADDIHPPGCENPAVAGLEHEKGAP